jgi:hypothetical protein
MKRLCPVSDSEMVDLIDQSTNGKAVQFAFGTGGAALEFDDEQPLPWYVERLGLLRGVLNQNCEGAGI